MELLCDRNELASGGGTVNAITTRATHEYLTRVRTSLADIAAGEVDDLLDDVRPHLADIAAEIGPDCTLKDLIDRLGTPEQYAAELRAAGDYPLAPLDSAPRPTKAPRFALWSMLVASFFLLIAAASAVSAAEVGILYAGITLCGTVIGIGAFTVARRGPEALDGLPEVAWLRTARETTTGQYLRSLAPGWWIGAALIFIGATILMTRGRPGDTVLAIPIFAILAGLVIFAGQRVGAHRGW